ncbi:MAG: RHS repeat-associated core domain-containing protein, partial [Phycisphaerales bacterium]
MVAISDEQSQQVEKYEYSVYGRVRIMAPNGQSRTVSIIGNPYYFTGRRLDGETGLYYYRARYYSPEIGRFLQTDPIGYSDSLN